MSYPYDPDGPLSDEVPIGRVSLDIQKFGTYRQVSGEFMRNHLRLNMERNALLRSVVDEMVYELSTMVQVHNLPPEEVVETGTLACDRPASWWQQWKQDVAAKHRLLAWLVRRWPVRYDALDWYDIGADLLYGDQIRRSRAHMLRLAARRPWT